MRATPDSRIGALSQARGIATSTATCTLDSCYRSGAVSLGIGSAAAVQVGRAIGRQDHRGTRRAGFSAILVGAAFMGCAALVMRTWPQSVARYVTSDESVIPG